MAIIRFGGRPYFRQNWTDFERMRQEMDELFNAFSGGYPAEAGATVYPALNISEDTNNIYVRAEIPGVASADLDISVEGDTLAIKGERKACQVDEKVSFHRREIQCGRFSRAVTLPSRVDAGKVGAKAANGILTITLPKAEESKPRQIKVTGG